MSEDVTRFLSQVKELGERRVEEDEARSRELEEKILQDRKERQARRRERARSISPQKSSPMNTPLPYQPINNRPLERLDLLASPTLRPPSGFQSQLSAPKAEASGMATSTPLISTPLSKENELPLESESKSGHLSSPSRNGTVRGLSWQRRPHSQAPERRNRPKSMFATGSSNSFGDQEISADNLTRDQISAALASKDSSWFRQTSDRGASSAAYRRTQVEDTQTVNLPSAQTQLPGMSRSGSGEPFRIGEPALTESSALRSTVTSPISVSDIPKLVPPSDVIQTNIDSNREVSGPFPPLVGRTSPAKLDRPVSPTKGTGGFVQSAMLKRSESVNKRWSVQSPMGLQRVDPVVTNRTGTTPKIRPQSVYREFSTESARPGSSEGNKEVDRPPIATSPSLKPSTVTTPEPNSQDTVKASPPASPSKTMDPRRWSPQKSSWLESALNKPESPKVKATQAAPNQPAWMAELQKAKAQKAGNPGPESTKAPVSSHKHQVSIGGLMRSNAPGVNTASMGRGSLHGPSKSISGIGSSGANFPTLEPKPLALSGPVKPTSEFLTDTKQTSLPPVDRVKPETPPKKDFRANLRPRAPTMPEPTDTDTVEFKNIFGNLRKATTQNYVAPDVLKGNITRGKASLAVTGGPQKSEIVDEFKDAIKAKKKEFQVSNPDGKIVTRRGSVSHEDPIPEGLLKRAELGRSNTIKKGSISSEAPLADIRQPNSASQRDSTAANFAGRFERASQLEKRASVMEASSFRVEGQDESAASPIARKLSLPKPASGLAESANETSSPTRLPGKLSGGPLANRFNPALAGLISRGPPSMASGSGSLSGGKIPSSSNTEANDNGAGSGPTLTHMTKNRARGPKRKAPTASSEPPKTTPESKFTTTKQIGTNNSAIQDSIAHSPPTESMTTVDPSKTEQVQPLQLRPKPVSLTSASRINTQPEANSSSEELQPISPGVSSPGKLNIHRMSRFMDPVPIIDRKQSPEQQKPLETPLKTRGFSDRKTSEDAQYKPQARSPSLNKPKVPLPESTSLPPARPSSKLEADGIGASANATMNVPLGGRPLPTPPIKVIGQSLNTSARPLPTEPEKKNPDPSTSVGNNSSFVPSLKLKRSPSKPADTSNTLRDFFGPQRRERNYSADTAELLTRRPGTEASRIRTFKAQLFLFSADGKKQTVPAHLERTLFEHDTYLCTHSFKDEAGRQVSEVYLWIGGEVSEQTIKNVAVFAAREAQAIGCPLFRLKQGKEAPEFLQALGGIVTIHRGSSSKYDSLAPHMLCGRRYHGHVVLDEVDFAASALCSGFPYIITQGGRCYLWKGKGSSVDEVSCARLIGMDYALSGELEEIGEGHEPASFWNLFGGANRLGSADHWRLKPNYDKYRCRLFLSDAASKQQIIELPKFTQADLLPTSIYVIDAFFELYIVIGSRAQDQHASFQNALDFAQEYAILAASMEDRPFVPVSTVVLEGIPRDMKSVFRKWQDTLSPTVTNTNTGLKRGRSLRVVPLSQAIKALGE